MPYQQRSYLLLTIIGLALLYWQPASSQEGKGEIDAAARPPKMEIVRDAEGNGGWQKELHRVLITGIARNQDGEPVAHADIYVSSAFKEILAQTKTDARGHFELVDLQLPVDRNPPGGNSKSHEGDFSVFGVADGYGVTWIPECRYRPYARPPGLDPVDQEQSTTDGSFYDSDSMYVELTFRPPAKLAGRFTNDFGEPIPNAKIQLGYTDSLNRRSPNGSWRCTYQPPIGDHVRFSGIHALPSKYREAVTDANGRYSFDQLPRDTEFSAQVVAGYGYQPFSGSIATSKAGNKKRNTHHVGYDGVFDREFPAPRRVHVRISDDSTNAAAPGIAVFATAGNEVLRDRVAMTDKDGNALLALPPGHYFLHAEPKSDWSLLPTTMKLEIVEGSPKTLHQAISLSAAAVLKLSVVDENNVPVSNASFEFETADSSTRQPLHSQEVYSDYPHTNAAGELTVYAPPGKRSVHIAASKEFEAVSKIPQTVLDLEAGKTVTQQFVVKRTAEHPQELPIAEDPHRIYTKWLAQAKAFRSMQAVIHLRMIRGAIHGAGINPSELQTELQQLDSDQVPDLLGLLSELAESQVRASPGTIAVAGNRRREDISHENPDGGSHIYSSIVNGPHALFYGSANNQINVLDAASSRRGFTSLRDFVPAAMLSHRRPPLTEPQVAGNRVLFNVQQGQTLFSLKADLATGFVYEQFRTTKAGFNVSHYFAPKKLPNGAYLPQAHIQFESRNEKLTRLDVHLIDKVTLFDAIPPDTFALSVPAGSNIFDQRGKEQGQQGDFRRAKHAVRDIIKFLDRKGP